MELRQMKQFLAVAETGSFAAAAERLYLSRPAVSKTIAALEQELGLSLFLRSRTGVTLTPAGEALLGKVRAAVSACEALEREVGRLHAHREHLRIGLTYGQNIIFMDKFARFREAHPEIALQVIDCSFDDFPSMMASGALDIGCSGMKLKDAAGLTAMPVYRSELYWGVRSDSEIAARGYILEEELRQLPHCIPKGGSSVLSDHENITRQRADGLFESDTYPYENIFDDNMFYLLKLVERGEGVLSIARDAIPASVQGVKFVPCLENKRYWEVQVYLPPGEPSAAVRLAMNEIFFA